MTRRARLRPAHFDDLGLRRALNDRALPLLVAAVTFLAALALAGAAGAAALAQRWQEGAAAALTVQVPQPDQPAADNASHLDSVLQVLRATPGIAAAQPLSAAELDALLRPWLGKATAALAVPLPAVIEVHLADRGLDLDALEARLDAVAPGTLVESHGRWVSRLAVLVRSLQACAWLALGVVSAVAAVVVALATRAGIAARREAIEIVHELGAADGYIAARFARRVTVLAAAGGAAGAIVALPVLLTLAALAAPFAASPASPPAAAALPAWAGALPATLWLALAILPFVVAAIGFLTALMTVRHWLRRLP